MATHRHPRVEVPVAYQAQPSLQAREDSLTPLVDDKPDAQAVHVLVEFGSLESVAISGERDEARPILFLLVLPLTMLFTLVLLSGARLIHLSAPIETDLGLSFVGVAAMTVVHEILHRR